MTKHIMAHDLNQKLTLFPCKPQVMMNLKLTGQAAVNKTRKQNISTSSGTVQVLYLTAITRLYKAIAIKVKHSHSLVIYYQMRTDNNITLC